MYSREVNGQVLEFGVSGKLVMNVLVMYDRETGTLWSQLLGKAIAGEQTGVELEYLPSWQTTWEDWKSRHPGTLALRKGYSGERDPYFSYYTSGVPGVVGETVRDDRLARKQFVIGVASDTGATAYPFSVLSEEGIVNDTVGGLEVLVVFDAENASGVVFNREHNGTALTFRSHDGLTLIDDQTGTLWDGLTGKALSGELSGTQLSRVKSTSSFWFGWKDFYPSTAVYGIDQG